MRDLEITLDADLCRETLGSCASSFTYDEIKNGCSLPETWNCVDCGANTAPGMAGANAVFEAVNAGRAIRQRVDKRSEIYCTTPTVWAAASLGGHEGCLCVGCLEKRLGRTLNREDFILGHPFNGPQWPRTKRLKDRIERASGEVMAKAA
jgi:hypothetical protein